MSSRCANRRMYDDTPDTDEAFVRLTALPDGPERAALREELVNSWLPLSERLAGRFRDRGESVEDLCQVAAVGLLKAVDGFDPALGTPFVAYAVPTITGEIKRHFRDHLWTLHVPRRVQELRNRVRTARHELQCAGTGEPTVRELAEHTGLSETDVRDGLHVCRLLRQCCTRLREEAMCAAPGEAA